jgi:hypothetical protein
VDEFIWETCGTSREGVEPDACSLLRGRGGMEIGSPCDEIGDHGKDVEEAKLAGQRLIEDGDGLAGEEKEE